MNKKTKKKNILLQHLIQFTQLITLEEMLIFLFSFKRLSIHNGVATI